MSTVSNWIDHLNKPAEEVAGSIYPGAGSSEFLLVLLLIAVWIGWTFITDKSESDDTASKDEDDSSEFTDVEFEDI